LKNLILQVLATIERDDFVVPTVKTHADGTNTLVFKHEDKVLNILLDADPTTPNRMCLYQLENDNHVGDEIIEGNDSYEYIRRAAEWLKPRLRQT
jgi:hypothetical protein